MKKSFKQRQRPRRIRQSRRLTAAEKGTQSNVAHDEARPHLDFLNRFRGSLPETITESDLETLNLGLRFLFAWLRKARQQHDKAAEGERDGAFAALGALSQFIMLFDAPLTELLHKPFLQLQNALAALDQNNVLPILKPVSRPGGTASSQAHLALQGHAAGTVMRLRTLDHFDPRLACTLVAKELAKLGVPSQRGTKAITANTIRHWCDNVASDVGRHGTAAMMFDSMFTAKENEKFQALPSAKAQSFALASLRQYVREMFPTLPTTKPS